MVPTHPLKARCAEAPGGAAESGIAVFGFGLDSRYAPQQRVAAGSRNAHKKETGVSAGRIAADIGKIEILCDQETRVGLRGAPHVRVGATGQLLCANGVDVVSKSGENGTRRSGRFSSSLIFTV